METKFLTTGERGDLIRLHKRTRDSRISDRIKTILLLDQGWSYDKIAQALFLDNQSIRNYHKIYTDAGVKGLTELHYKGRACQLTALELEEFKAPLDVVTYLKADSVIQYAQTRYGVKYSSKGIISLIRRLGFVYKKPKLVPGSPDANLQREFVSQYQQIKQDLEEGDEIVFLDSVHPQHNVRNGYGWILKDRVKHLPTNSGRSRVNIIGALNARNMYVTVSQELTNVNAKSIANILLKLLNKYPGSKNIYVILDNARYNRAKIMKLFEFTRIKLVFLPPYSPNLNLIERLWRFFHNKVTRFRFYKTFAQFQAACRNFFGPIDQYQPELKTLLVDNFNIISPNFSKFILD